MKDKKLPQAKGYIEKHRRLSVWHKLVLSMAAMVVFITTYMLILPAITMENNTICGKTEHTHTDACYEENVQLVCDLYDEAQPSEAVQAAESGESAAGGEAAAGSADNADNAADTAADNGGGGGNDVILHTHSDECYNVESVLACGQEEHTHTEECYPVQESEESEESAEAEAEVIDPSDEKYISIDENLTEVEVSDKERLFESILKNASDNTIKLNITKQSAKETKYVEDSKSYETRLELDFRISSAEIAIANANEQVYILEIPEDLGVSINYDTAQTGSYTTGGGTFTYYFRKGTDGNTYIEFDFGEDYEAQIGGSGAAEGYVEFSAEIGSKYVDEAENINIDFGGDVTLTIKKSDIDFPKGSTANYDIGLNKGVSYDYKNNELTYTVQIYSVKGTEEIDFNDAIEDLCGLNMKLESLTVYEMEKDAYGDSFYSTNTELTDIEKQLSVDATEGSVKGSLTKLEAGKGYQIVYTYKVDEMEPGTSESLVNKAEASSPVYDDYTISSSAEKTVKVYEPETSWLGKTGVSNSDGTVTWTIIVGDGKQSLKGCKLTDEMFSEATDEVTIEPESGWEWVTKDKEIEFIDEDTKQYTITYTTKSDGWADASNSVTLTDGDGNALDSKTATVDGSSSGNVRKGNELIDSDGEVKGLKWYIAVDVPEGGIPVGYITDKISPSGSSHYISYSDANGIISKFGEVAEAYGIKFGEVEFTSNGYSYSSELAEDGSYSGFRVYLPEGVSYDVCKSFGLSYTTTADTSAASDKQYYSNEVNVVGRKAESGVTLNKRVVKKSGSGSTSTSSVKNDTGEVSWIVEVYLENDATAFTVTDNLPSGIELSELSVSYDGKTYSAISANGKTEVNGSSGGLTFTTSVDSDNKVTTDASGNVGAGTTVYFKYKCVLSGDLPTKKTTYDLTNSAKVTIGKEPTDYGSDSQTQHLTVGSDPEPVDKTYNWDSEKQKLSYSVVLNPNSETFGDGTSYTLVDTLTYSDDPNRIYKAHRVIELDLASVKVYHIAVDENGELLVDENGDYVKGAELNSDEWEFVSYKPDTTHYDFGSGFNYDAVSKIITAELPDNTPLIFEYDYNMIVFQPILQSSSAQSDPNVLANSDFNRVTINGYVKGNNSSKGCNEEWQNSSSSAGIYNYTVYKHAVNKLNEGLEGAVFELYAYDGASGEYKYVDKYITDSNGYVSLGFSDNELKSNTMYYLVESLPPDGYKLPDNPEKMYFYRSDDNGDKTDMPSEIPTDSMDISQPENRQVVKQVANEAEDTTPITIVKKWLDKSGNEAEAGADSIKAEIVRYYKARGSADTGSKKVDVSYNIDGQDSWDTSKEDSKMVNAGDEVSVIIKYVPSWGSTGSYTPSLTLYKNGEKAVDVNAGFPNTEWTDNASTYTYTFTADEDTVITGVVGISGEQFTVTWGNGGGGSVNESVSSEDSISGDYTYDGVYETVTLNDGNGWTTTVEGLPISGVKDNQYVDYMYAVREATLPDEYISSVEVDGDTVTINNTEADRKFLTVTKRWFDSNGKEMTVADGEIKFTLWRKTVGGADGEQVGGEVYTVGASDGWTKKVEITELPTADDSGNEYTYFVKEEAVDNYDTAYVEEDGVITIKNTEKKSYQLPMTGGRGTIGYTMAGGAMLMLALCLYIHNRLAGGRLVRSTCRLKSLSDKEGWG